MNRLAQGREVRTRGRSPKQKERQHLSRSLAALPHFASISAVLLLFFLAGPKLGRAAETPLAVVDAGVEQSEDAPFAGRDYQFLPGDYLYFSFEIAGFSIRSEQRDEVHKIALTYDVTAQDANGIALAAPSSGEIRTEISPEDKHWMPKRRASFLLPSFVAAGQYRVHVHVKDLVSNSDIAQDFPFRMGGTEIQPSPSISVQNFRFLRNPNDREPLEVAAYNPGDTVYTRFAMAGFKIGPQNHYHLSYGVTVLRPDGKPYLDQPKAAELQAASFYPAQFLPGVIDVKTTADSARGEYVLVLTVHDLLGNTSSQIKRAFSIE